MKRLIAAMAVVLAMAGGRLKHRCWLHWRVV